MKFFFVGVLVWLVCTSEKGYGQTKTQPANNYSQNLKSILTNGTTKKTDSIALVLTVREPESFLQQQPSLRVLLQHKASKTILVKLTHENLIRLLDDKQIIFADILRKPKEEVTTGAFDMSANNIRFVQQHYPQLNGEPVTVSVKETRFDTSDIDFKGRWMPTNLESPSGNTHASIMATIIAGGGNSSPFAKGVAWGASLTSADFSTLLPDQDSTYRKYKVSVQNHSYGVDIENFYGSDAAAYDMSVVNNPELVHVFSAGNLGTSASTTGTYAGVTGYANLTGSFKMAKNVLTVGAIDSFYQVEAPSSKGPSFDGRVKPDLVAYGDAGSSGAAAVVSGTAALLQQAYMQAHNNVLPPAALIRAILVNSATDIGPRHVDYSAGFGNMNAFQAVKTMDGGHYAFDELVNGQEKSFALTVPVNATQLKVTIAWSDTAATPNATKALVNDLDMRLNSATSNEVWLPWVLSKTADKDSLALPARRGIDSLNNVEQITIDNPTPGLYTLLVRGTRIVTDKQAFAMAYQVDTANTFLWTYPVRSTPLLNNSKTVLRWETTYTGKGNLEYTTDGTTWLPVATDVELSKKYYSLTLPSVDAFFQLRATPDAATSHYTSDSISVSAPVRLRVGFNCADSFLLYWNQAGTESQVYRLGDFYMEPLVRTADTVLILHKSQNPALHYAVAPVTAGKEGFRSFTINYRFQGVECYFSNFLVQLQERYGSLSTQLGSLYNVKEVQFLKLTPGGYKVIKTLSPSALSISHVDSSLLAGLNTYKVQLLLNNGQIITSPPETIYYFPASPVIVFPNPGRQHEPVQIIVADWDEYTIQIFDASGRIVHKQLLRQERQSLPPYRLGKGIYFVLVTGKGERFTQKIIIN